MTERPDPRAVHSTLSKNLLRQSYGGFSSLLLATFPAGLGGVRKDAIAGITVAAIAVPQAMAYALIAGVEPRFGLYSAIVVTALASVFGSSAQLVNGPTNAISLVVFSALAQFDPDARVEAYEAMFLLAMMVGVVQVTVALLKLGDLTRYISEAVVLGFMAGAGLLVALSQVANLFGLAERGTGHQHLLHRLYLTATEGGPVNPRALALGVGTATLTVIVRRLSARRGWLRVDMLLALVVATALAGALGWTISGTGGARLVGVVGDVPSGLPRPHFPDVRVGWVRDLLGSATAIAFLGLLEALAISKSIAHQTGQVVDFNRQCLAEGLANFGGGLFQCLPGSGSLTRSAINHQAGAVSRWSGVFSAAAVGLVVVVAAPLARYIPKAALAGLLLVTAASLVDWRRLRYALHASRYDAGLVLATAFSAVFLSVELSILIGTGLSIVLYVPRAAKLKATELTISAEQVIHDRQPGEPSCSKMVLFDLEGELFFGAAPELERYFADVAARAEGGARVVVLRVKRTRNPDMVCMERLQHFLVDMNEAGVVVLLCGVRADFARAMDNLRFSSFLPQDRVFREDESAPGSATLEAIRDAYALLDGDLCATCPRRAKAEYERFYYMI